MRECARASSPEQRVLLACARRDLHDAHRKEIAAACAGTLDWDWLEQAAADHGVAYFVFSHLLSEGVGEPARRVRWQASLLRESARSLVLRDWQQRLARAFDEARLPAAWLKGLVLSDGLYGRSDARQCSDLDVLAEAAQVPAIGNVLEGQGFRPYTTPVAGKDEHPLGSHHVSYIKQDVAGCPVLIEVHERLSGPAACQPAVAGLLARSRTTRLGDVPVRVLAPEDELLVLALHAHQHNYALLRCLMDLAEFVQRFHAGLDWQAVVERARAGRCLTRLLAGLDLAERWLDLGEAAACRAKLPALSESSGRLVQSLSLDTLLNIEHEQDERLRLRLARLMDGWSDVLRAYAPRVFPPRAYVRALCPSALRSVPLAAHLCYLLRIARRGVTG